MADQRESLPELDPAILRGPVREALGSDLAELVDWQARALQGGATRSTSVYRVEGLARAHGATLPWSLVLKVCRPRAGGDDPSQWNYWKREPLAYHSGLLRDLPGGVVAPRWFGNVERPDGAVWLWLEDVAGVRERPWPADDFGRAARRLGRFNGAYLAGRPRPAAPWLGRGRLRAWVAFCAPAVAALPRHLAHPLVRGRFGDATVTALQRLWAERETFLDALERLPRTFCHLDAFPRNLVVRRGVDGDDRLVALDWAGAGIGAVGEELAPLVASSLLFFEADVAAAQELDTLTFAHYLAGLREAGWPASEPAVRFGYTAAAALRYGLGLALDVGIAADERAHGWAEQVLGRSVEEMLARDAALADFLAARGEEARQLLPLAR